MSAARSRWGGVAWQFQEEADALIDLMAGQTLVGDFTITGDLTVTGDVAPTGDQTITGDLSVTGDVTLNDGILDTVIVNGRIATASRAGAALAIDDTYTVGEGVELKYAISDFAGIPLRDSNEVFVGVYSRAESIVDDASAHAVGVEGWGVANGVGVGQVEGLRGWAYGKGDTTDTIAMAYGVRGEFSMDAGRANTLTLTTEAAGLLARITSGKVDAYTKIHGVITRFGDMDGQARTYGSALRALDGVEAGTAVLTNVIYTDMVAASFLEVAADTQGGAVIGAFSNDTIGTTANDGYLIVKIGATSYKIPFWDDAA